MNTLKEYCEMLSQMRKLHHDKCPKGFKWFGVEELLLKEGCSFAPAPLPKGVRRGVAKQCYMNAARVALRRDDLVYCEGYAVAARVPIPLAHAWLCDRQGRAIDPTWKEGIAYLGVPIKKAFLRKQLARTGHYGILMDAWVEGWPMLKMKPRVWKEDL